MTWKCLFIFFPHASKILERTPFASWINLWFSLEPCLFSKLVSSLVTCSWNMIYRTTDNFLNKSLIIICVCICPCERFSLHRLTASAPQILFLPGPPGQFSLKRQLKYCSLVNLYLVPVFSSPSPRSTYALFFFSISMKHIDIDLSIFQLVVGWYYFLEIFLATECTTVHYKE